MFRLRQKHIDVFSALLVMVGLILLLWLPFGLRSVIGGVEEWTTLYLIQRGENAVFIPQAPTRPFNLAPYVAPYLLMPDHLYLGYSLLVIGVFIAKAGVIYALLRRLIPDNPTLAFLSAILFVIYPADLGLFTFRAFPIMVAIVGSLVCIYLLVYYWQKPSFLLWSAIWILQVMSLLTYEVLYPVILASPLLLIWLDKRLSQRFWMVTLLWSFIPAILFAWLIWNMVGTNSGTYIATRLVEAQTTGATGFSAMLGRLPNLLLRHLSEWEFTVRELVGRSPYLPLSIVSGGLVGVFSWKLMRRTASKFRFSWVLILGGVGLVAMLLSYAAYLPSSYGNIHWRVYYLTAIGPSLLIAGFISWLGGRLPLIAAGLSGIVVSLAVLHALDQHSILVDSSAYLQRLLGSIVRQAPAINSDAVVVLLDDEANIADSDWRLSGYDDALRGALTYLYDYPVEAIFCTNADILGDPAGKRLCRWEQDGIDRLFRGVESHYAYRQLVIFETRAGGYADMLTALPESLTNSTVTVNYEPERLINRSAPLPARVSTLFTCWPLETCLPLNTSPQAHIWLGFDRMMRGVGWQAATPELRQLWMTGKRATIIINPTLDKPLEIQFGLSRSLADDILQSLTLNVNNMPVEIERINPESLTFRGIISRDMLQPETELAFNVSRTEGDYQLSLQFDWLEIKPFQAADQVRIDFDSEIDGTGWEGPNPGQSQQWMIDNRSTMNFYLPTEHDLGIRFKINLYLQQDVLDSLRLIVNNQPVALEKIDDANSVFQAAIPRSALRDQTELVFVINRLISPASLGVNSDTRGLGLLFDWLEIRPKSD